MKSFAPLLAEVADISKLKYPLYASPKLDGIRCLIRDGMPVSRKLLPIPNDMIRAALSNRPELEGLDGELIAGSPTDEKCFNTTTRLVGKKEAVHEDWAYYVFDCFTDSGEGFHARLKSTWDKVTDSAHPNIVVLPQLLVQNEEELLSYEDGAVLEGYEGVMVRSMDGLYKFGRSTANEGILLKIKRFVDTEVEVLAMYEGKTNNNVALKDALGHTKRSTAKAGKVPNGTLGGFFVREVSTGREFKVGGGWNEAEGADMWARKKEMLGSIFVCRYQAVGVLNKPRFPQWKGPRAGVDMP